MDEEHKTYEDKTKEHINNYNELATKLEEERKTHEETLKNYDEKIQSQKLVKVQMNEELKLYEKSLNEIKQKLEEEKQISSELSEKINAKDNSQQINEMMQLDTELKTKLEEQINKYSNLELEHKNTLKELAELKGNIIYFIELGDNKEIKTDSAKGQLITELIDKGDDIKMQSLSNKISALELELQTTKISNKQMIEKFTLEIENKQLALETTNIKLKESNMDMKSLQSILNKREIQIEELTDKMNQLEIKNKNFTEIVL